MGKRQNNTNPATIGRYLHSQIRKHALWTGVSLLVISIAVALLSMKFSTERLVRRTCADVGENSRILVETYSISRYQSYHNEVIEKLSARLDVKDLHVTKIKPESSWNHYKLDDCFLDWRSNFKVKFYVPAQWNDEEYFVRGTLRPKYFRSDLFLLMVLLAFSLLVSYQFGTRKLLRRIEDNIAGPIEEVWQGLQTGEEPRSLELKEFQDLWSSLQEYKNLLLERNRMLLSTQYTHELKRPSYYQHTQIQRMLHLDSVEALRKSLIETHEQSSIMLTQMEDALRKIANNDFAGDLQKIDIRRMIPKSFKNVEVLGSPYTFGDITNYKILFKNLYGNAEESSPSKDNIRTIIKEQNDSVIIKIQNPVEQGTQIDTRQIFISGVTSKAKGTGMGLSLCKSIVEIHDGKISASYEEKCGLFEVEVELPTIMGIHCNAQGKQVYQS